MLVRVEDGFRWAYAWLVTRLHRDERGQDLLEYALLGGLIALAITAAGVVTAMTGGLGAMADGITSCIDFKSGTPCKPFNAN